MFLQNRQHTRLIKADHTQTLHGNPSLPFSPLEHTAADDRLDFGMVANILDRVGTKGIVQGDRDEIINVCQV